MFTIDSATDGRAVRWILGIQAALVPATLLAAIGPAPGQAALYVPLTTAQQAQGVSWAQRHGGDLLAPGPLPGSVFITSKASSNVLSAATEGALLLSVPPMLCGKPDTRRDPNP